MRYASPSQQFFRYSVLYVGKVESTIESENGIKVVSIIISVNLESCTRMGRGGGSAIDPDFRTRNTNFSF